MFVIGPFSFIVWGWISLSLYLSLCLFSFSLFPLWLCTILLCGSIVFCTSLMIFVGFLNFVTVWLFWQVKTVDGITELQIPPGTQPGDVLVLARKGAPKLNRPSIRGDHLFTIKVSIPKRVRYDLGQILWSLFHLLLIMLFLSLKFLYYAI